MPLNSLVNAAPSTLYVVCDDEGQVRGTTSFILVAKNALAEAEANGVDISDWSINEYHFRKEV